MILIKEVLDVAYTYKPKEMAKYIGVSVRTLQNWDRSGVLVAHRTPKNRRFYTQDQLEAYLSQQPQKGEKR